MKKLYLLLTLLVLAFSSCTKEMVFPVASGRPYEVLVVVDKDLWERPSGRALFEVLDTDVPGLPQSERSFRISQTTPDEMSNTLRIFRNVIVVDINPQMYTQTKLRFMRDKYAMEQIVLTINAPSEESFAEFCTRYRQDIVDFLTKTEMNRLIVQLRKKYSKATYDLAWQMFECKFFAPEELKSWKKGTDFLWTSNNTATGMENICIYSYPYEGPHTFNKQYVLHKRDSVMKENLPGEKPGMYMATDTLCTLVKPIVVHGQYAMEARGLWYMENDCMGGPFVSISRVDEEAGKVIVAEGFVYAPEKMKRGLMRRLEGALYTLALPAEQKSMVEISADVNVEEEKKTTAAGPR